MQADATKLLLLSRAAPISLRTEFAPEVAEALARCAGGSNDDFDRAQVVAGRHGRLDDEKFWRSLFEHASGGGRPGSILVELAECYRDWLIDGVGVLGGQPLIDDAPHLQLRYLGTTENFYELRVLVAPRLGVFQLVIKLSKWKQDIEDPTDDGFWDTTTTYTVHQLHFGFPWVEDGGQEQCLEAA